MEYKKFKTEDFRVVSNKDNTCDGCWFKDNSKTINCRKGGAKFANSVFSRAAPAWKGSCFKMIARLKIEREPQDSSHKPQAGKQPTAKPRKIIFKV